MVERKKQINIFISKTLWQKFAKKCIDLDKAKTKVLNELIEKFVKER